MNIIYLHGLSSSGQSNTARLLRELLLDDNVVSPDIPVEPIEALQMLLELAGKYPVKDSVVIGTSMGAMYAFQMKGYRRILVNPAFHVSDFLQDKIGTNLPFFNQREDEESNFYVSEELCDCYRSMETSLWSNNFEGSKTFLLSLETKTTYAIIVKNTAMPVIYFGISWRPPTERTVDTGSASSCHRMGKGPSGIHP